MHPRKPMLALSCALLIAASPAVAKTRYVYLVNDMPDRIESFSLARNDSDAWKTVLRDEGLKAGESETLAIKQGKGDGCLYDAKIVLRGGRTFVHRGLDFCKYVSYHPGRYLRGAVLSPAGRVAQDAAR